MHAGMGGSHEFLVRVRTTDPTQPEILLRDYSDWVP
jgi:hypothetical protein